MLDKKKFVSREEFEEFKRKIEQKSSTYKPYCIHENAIKEGAFLCSNYRCPDCGETWDDYRG